ncbi:MAG: hypothetical protein K2X34_10225, partial [Hyphomonadaceae bacterium]|nr:hypothetical protein [Hyphomonadaceae bacterium]
AWNHQLGAIADTQQVTAAAAHLAGRASGSLANRDAGIERRFNNAPERHRPFCVNGLAGLIGYD